MTRASSTDDGGRDLTAADETSRGSVEAVLAVLRDRPSILVGLVIALLGQTVIGSVLRPVVAPSQARVLLFVGPPWIATATLVGFVLWVERRPLASVGVVWPTWSDLWLGLAGATGGLLTLPVVLPLRNALGFGPNEGSLLTLLQLPLWAVVAVVITAAITEEVLFRAYPIERFAEMTGSNWAAAAFSFVVFVLLHVPFWGVGHVLTISGISIILTALYVRYRRLWPAAVMHFLSNFVLLVVLPRIGSVPSP